MDYKNLYFAFIDNFKDQVFEEGQYTEVHHIIPRYCGGGDEQTNLVRLTHRQHVFVHHLWARYTNDPQAWLAYKMMSGQNEGLKTERSRAGGLTNVRSGHLDRIRIKANTPERQSKLKKLIEEMKSDGRLDRAIKCAQDAWRGSSHTEEFKKAKSEDYKNRFRNNPEYRDSILRMQRKGIETKSEKDYECYKSLMENAERNEEYIGRNNKRSKYTFISPEGLVFGSATDASRYLGNVKPYAVDNWCKRGQYGWSRVPKEEQE